MRQAVWKPAAFHWSGRSAKALCHAVVMDHSLSTLVLIAGAVGVLALLRRLSKPVDAASLEAPNVSTVPFSPADEHRDESRLRIRNRYFRSFDFETGPPDAECFYDELFVEMEDTVSSYSWTNSYFVATPSGIAQVMQEEGWNEIFGADLLIVRRFDREFILRSLLDHMSEQYEVMPEPLKDPHFG